MCGTHKKKWPAGNDRSLGGVVAGVALDLRGSCSLDALGRSRMTNVTMVGHQEPMREVAWMGLSIPRGSRVVDGAVVERESE